MHNDLLHFFSIAHHLMDLHYVVHHVLLYFSPSVYHMFHLDFDVTLVTITFFDIHLFIVHHDLLNIFWMFQYLMDSDLVEHHWFVVFLLDLLLWVKSGLLCWSGVCGLILTSQISCAFNSSCIFLGWPFNWSFWT